MVGLYLKVRTLQQHHHRKLAAMRTLSLLLLLSAFSNTIPVFQTMATRGHPWAKWLWTENRETPKRRVCGIY